MLVCGLPCVHMAASSIGIVHTSLTQTVLQIDFPILPFIIIILWVVVVRCGAHRRHF